MNLSDLLQSKIFQNDFGKLDEKTKKKVKIKIIGNLRKS